MIAVEPVVMEGVIVLDKPAGQTSARCVRAIKHLLPHGTKIGHAGTLDQFATGVLLLLIGKATKRCEMLMGQAKTYEATIKLGATTASDDPETPEVVNSKAVPVTREQIERVLPNFVGTIQQRPPNFSALKVSGRRASDRVRAGQSLELQPRAVRIDRIELLEYDWPLLRLRIDCGRGTYIRALARDVGETLNVGGYLTELRRTRIGDYDIRNAVTLEELRSSGVERYLI